MADIIVTTPKSRMAEAAREAEEIKRWGGGEYHRDYRAPRIPNVEVGDRVYYVEDGYIRGFALVCKIVKATICTADGKPAFRVCMDATTWKWIKPVMVTPQEVPRSFMYAENLKRYAPLGRGLSRESVEIVGGWLDPRPEVKEPCRP
ncbi:MAG: hypothetical protein V3W11_04265 [bacterium]